MNEVLPPGATPLGPDDQAGLLVHASTKGQLDQFEAQNIANAIRWAMRSSKLRKHLLSVSGLRLLHKQMLGETWTWAGQLRTRDTNIGVNPLLIQEQVHALCGDAVFWVEHESWPWPVLAVRFHHRLVSVHPFPNGNGRHARLAANLLLHYHDQQWLPWGGGQLGAAGPTRDEYLAALREADEGDFQRLVQFAQITS